MELLYLLSEFRTEILDKFFLLITEFGNETLAIVAVLILFWCVNKKLGYMVLYNLVFGTMINQAAKVYFAVPRPWVLDPSFKPVEAAIPAATGYSFPSGHTATATAVYGSIAYGTKKKQARILSVIAVLLIAFSRMYLGVHTPYDVSASLVIGAILIFVLSSVLNKDSSDKTIKRFALIQTAFVVAMLVGFVMLVLKAGEDSADGIENYAKLMGLIAAMIIVSWYDTFKNPFDTKAVWWAQIIKVIVGFALVLAVKEGLKAPLLAIMPNEALAGFARYFIMLIVGGLIYPRTFSIWKRFEK